MFNCSTIHNNICKTFKVIDYLFIALKAQNISHKRNVKRIANQTDHKNKDPVPQNESDSTLSSVQYLDPTEAYDERSPCKKLIFDETLEENSQTSDTIDCVLGSDSEAQYFMQSINYSMPFEYYQDSIGMVSNSKSWESMKSLDQVNFFRKR